MKKLIFVFITFLIFSCGVKKNINSDPYIGNYSMTIFDVDQLGDVDLNLMISKSPDGYESSFKDSDGNDPFIEVDSSNVIDGFYEIDAYYQGYELFFKLKIVKDKLSGSLMEMYDIKGKRVK